MVNTGFKACGEPLFAGDILAYYGGNCGYCEVVQRSNEFWIVDCSAKVWGCEFPEEEIEEPFRLEDDLGCHWTKVDKDNPTKTPSTKLECECCDSVVGEFDDDTGEFTWFDNCAYHEVPEEGYVNVWCHECYPDRATKEKPAPILTEVEEYFFQQYEKASFRVVPGHWPAFKSKEEVDQWLGSMNNMMSKAFGDAFGEEV